MQKDYRYKAVSLFCGAGGLDLGFKQAGVQVVWANDLNKDACATYSLHSPDTKVIRGDISKLSLEDIPCCDIVLGGFPCQGFSVGGSRKEEDPRNALYKHFVHVVNVKKPNVFVGENVKGLLTLGNAKTQIVNDFKKCGYNVFYQLVNAKDYGVPQNRERLIIVGFRSDLRVRKFKLLPYTGESLTLKDVLWDVPAPLNDEVYEASYSPFYMRRNRRREWDEVSYTILATARHIPIHPSSPPMVRLGADNYIFGEQSDTRRFSYKECAAIQTFPSDIEFAGMLLSKYKQIGNAVPVKLAEHIAKSVLFELRK